MSALLENEPRLIARERGHGQAEVTNTHATLADFDRQYVCFSGYFGEYCPELFAAAPDLLEALRECADELEAEIEARRGGELPRRIERDLETVRKARAAITKAGRAA